MDEDDNQTFRSGSDSDDDWHEVRLDAAHRVPMDVVSRSRADRTADILASYGCNPLAAYY